MVSCWLLLRQVNFARTRSLSPPQVAVAWPNGKIEGVKSNLETLRRDKEMVNAGAHCVQVVDR